MRQGWVWAVGTAAVSVLSGCGAEPVQAAPLEDVLVLEVGGEQPSLRAALVAMGRDVGPGHALRPRTFVETLDPNGGGPYSPGEGRVPGQDPSVGDGDGEGGPSEGYGTDGQGSEGPRSGEGDRTPDEPPIDPEPPVESPWVIVKLPKYETLTHIARRYLGDGRRFDEIMEWNGWSEPDTRKLREGQEIRIKRSEMK